MCFFSNKETPATIAYPIAAPQGLLKVLEKKRTIFYAFGYMEQPEDDNVQIIIRGIVSLNKKIIIN